MSRQEQLPEDYFKEINYLSWEREYKEKEIAQEIYEKEMNEKLRESRGTIIMNNPKIVLGTSKKSNSFDHAGRKTIITLSRKFPRFIKSKKSTKARNH
jgi:hypothetical protein